MMKNALFGGVNAAVLTPMNADLSIDLDRMAAHCRAASRLSRRAVTTAIRWAMQRSRHCARSGTVPRTRTSALPYSVMCRRSPAPDAGYAGACR